MAGVVGGVFDSIDGRGRALGLEALGTLGTLGTLRHSGLWATSTMAVD